MSFLETVKLKRFHQRVIGDFNRKNINWITATSTSDDCRFVEATRDSFLTQHILTPTRARGSDEPSILDLLFTSRNEIVESVDFHAPLGKSDHSVLKVMYRSVAKEIPETISYHYNKANYVKMRRMLDINWHERFNDCLMWGILRVNTMTCIPKKIINTGKRKFSYPLDRYSLSTRKKKHRLWKRYLESKDADVYKEYCKRRNQVRRLSRAAIKKYEKDITRKSKENCKLFWKFVSSKTKLKSIIPSLFTTKEHDPNKLTNDDQGKADILWKFFSSIFVKELDWIWILDENDRPGITIPLQLSISRGSILKKLESLNVNKSPGQDNIHPRVLKEITDVIVDPLLIIFKTSIKFSKLPSEWKVALVTPIFKNKGDKRDPENQTS